MAKPTRSVARAAIRDLRPTLLIGFITLALLVLAASQASAQQKKSSGDQTLIDMIDICGLLVEQGADAEDDLIDAGWTVDDVFQYGPYSREISASIVFSDDSDAYAFAVVESYPTAELGFCSLDIQGITSSIDLNIVSETYTADGSIAQDEFGDWHGSWESVEDDSIYLVLVHFEDANDYLLVQMNRISDASGSSSAK